MLMEELRSKISPVNSRIIYYRGLNKYQYHFAVHVRYHIITISIHGIWNQNIGNYLGPYIRVLDS